MAKISNVSAIAWDMDGTLIDSFKILKHIIEEASVVFGRKVPDEDMLLRNFHGSLEDTLKAIFELKTAEELEQVHDFYLANQGHHYEDLSEHLFEDAVALSERAHKLGIRQVVVTNRAHTDRGLASPRSIVARSLLHGRVEEIMCGDDPGAYRKPDPRALRDWLNMNQIDSSNFLVVGDQVVDAQFALALHARAVLVKREQEMHHIDQLPQGWDTRITFVDSLDDVTFE